MTAAEHDSGEAPAFLSDGGECGALLRRLDWTSHPLGPPEGWPPCLQTLVELMLQSRQAMFVAWGDELTFLYNDAYAEVLGAKHPSQGRAFAELWADIWPQFGPIVDRVLGGESVWFEDLPIIMERNGAPEQTWFSFSYTPVRDREGRVRGLFCACEETTKAILAGREHEEADAALRESEARFRNVADHAPVIMWVTDADGMCQYLNRNWYEFTGQTEEEALGLGWLDATHPDDKAEAERAFLEANAARAPFRVEYRLRRADGEYRWAIDAASPRFDGSGEFLGYVGSVIDIGERRQIEDRLRESEDRLRLATDASGVGIWDWNLADGQLRWDDRTRALFGLSPGKPVSYETVFLPALHPDDVAPTVAAIEAATRPGGTGAYDIDYRTIGLEDGVERWIRATGRAVFEGDKAVRFAGTVIEVSDRKRIEAALRESEARFRAIANTIDQMIWSTRPDGYHDFYNQRWYDFTGAPQGSTDGEGWNDMFHPDDQERAWARWTRSLETGQPYEIEYRLRHKSGEYRWVLGRALPMRDDAGEIVRWFGTCTDIHDRKAVEAALEEESRTLETLNETGAALAGELDLERVVQRVTDAGVELTGAQFGAFFYNVLNEAGESYMLYTLSGVERSAFDTFPMPRATAIFQPTFVGEGVIRSDDILADRRYGKSEPYYGMPEGHLPVRSYLAVPVASRSGEVIGGLFFGHPEPGRFDARHERLIVGLAGQASVAIDNARLFQAAQRELAERRRSEAALRESEADYRAAAELNPQVAWTAQPDGQLDRVAGRWREWTGHSGLGESWGLSLHPDDLPHTVEAWTRSVTTGVPYDVEHRVMRTDGQVRWARSRAYPRLDDGGGVVRWYGNTEDVHERKVAELELQRLNASLEAEVHERTRELRQAEESLRQAQKMEAIGQLTGGIAHDFNNLLTGIIGSLDLIKRRIESGRTGDIGRFMDAATTSAQRAAALTHRLLAFARRQSLDTKPTDVNRLVASMEELLHRTLGEQVELKVELSAGLWQAETDVNQLESALLNLAINARDAMPEGGALTIETANTTLDEAYAAQHEGLRAGDYVVVCVSDTGEGMTADVLERAFDPFFTTKPIGQGTGLGLSMIYGFARQTGGHVRLYSEAGQGTTVKLYLPRAEAAGPEAADGPRTAETPRGEGEVVLVVEDDPAVRLLVLELLSELGYTAMEAHDGPAALPIVNSETRIDLMISDVGLPGLNGRQLAEAAREKRPELPVLFITGYAEKATFRGGFLAEGMEMITKPFAADALATKIREMLARN